MESESDNEDDEISVDAGAAFNVKATIMYTKKELRSLINKLKNETKETRIKVSNDKFKKCIMYTPSDSDEEAFERFVGM